MEVIDSSENGDVGVILYSDGTNYEVRLYNTQTNEEITEQPIQLEAEPESCIPSDKTLFVHIGNQIIHYDITTGEEIHERLEVPENFNTFQPRPDTKQLIDTLKDVRDNINGYLDGGTRDNNLKIQLLLLAKQAVTDYLDYKERYGELPLAEHYILRINSLSSELQSLESLGLI